MFESQTRLTEHAQLTQHTAAERKCIKSTANNVKRRQRQQQQQQLVKKSAVQWTVIQFRSTDYACDSLCVWVCGKENTVYGTVYTFDYWTCQIIAKCLGSCQAPSRSLVLSFHFVSFRYLFIHFAYLSHTSLDCCCCCFCCFKCSLKSFLLLGTKVR